MKNLRLDASTVSLEMVYPGGKWLRIYATEEVLKEMIPDPVDDLLVIRRNADGKYLGPG